MVDIQLQTLGQWDQNSLIPQTKWVNGGKPASKEVINGFGKSES
jgi:hypothetical protein